MTLPAVAPGIRRLALPLPPPLREVNAYLIEGTGGWTLVDCGLHTEDAERALRAGLAAAGVRPGDVRHVFVTHLHPDHLGMAGTLERGGAQIVMHRPEAEAARRFWWGEAPAIDETYAWFERHGMPSEVGEDMREAWLAARRRVEPVARVRTVEDGERLELDGRALTVLWTPGHTDYHAVLVDEDAGVLFAGDHVLSRISSNVALYPFSRDDPLGDFLDSLRRVGRLAVRRILPAHGQPFDDLRGRVEELLAHHALRLRATLEAVGSGEPHAYAVCRTLFAALGSPLEERFALAETLAHLRYLERRGQVLELEGTPRRWRAASSTPPASRPAAFQDP